ncbi:zinc finger CCCH domain-containing protein 3 [Leptidea sinapis]|uniref:zinc finger CCCH domain-containing protein 3 n=1 Tax=Leptidea sinapis TaxID=189913 RepID=UPI002139FC43|nr:zinc finger CCCH domain-containing protein 3 [Leptidea sinapis]
MEGKSSSIVYINPNYKKKPEISVAPLKPSNCRIYVNQNFHDHNKISNQGKIFVNPNFIKAKNSNIEGYVNSDHHYSVNEHFVNNYYDHHCSANTHINSSMTHSIPSLQAAKRYTEKNCTAGSSFEETYTKTPIISGVSLPKSNLDISCPISKSRYSLVRKIHCEENVSTVLSHRQIDMIQAPSLNSSVVMTKQASLTPISKSRYSLVRKKQSVISSATVQTNSRMIKIGKYKTISVDNAKQTHVTVKVPQKFTCSKKLYLNSPRSLGNQLSTSLNRSLSRNLKKFNLSSDLGKTYLSNRLKTRENKGKLKLNNIPCRLYTKYGKCLRNSNGKCIYVHDKKHVSLCRKFLKGICHDKNCPLSHEVSVNKMPTCFFFLKGMCVKDNCPYLHVKLSEKTKICPDFVRGYCEKGDKCLLRHVLIKSRSVSEAQTKLLTPSKVRRKVLINKAITRKPSERQNKNVVKDNSKLKGEEDIEVINECVEARYFKETVSEDTSSGAIKPTRCKLGDLPSYIHL